MTSKTILYSTASYRATLALVRSSMVTVVIFDYWTEHPSLDAEPPGEQFFLQQGVNVVGIKTARNDWYQSLEMHDVCSAVVAATSGHRRIGYGGSMGAYAAINFADDLQLDSVIAICPQVSIDPAKAPFEWRWRAEAQSIEFCTDKIERPDPARRTRGHVIFDPRTVDRLHVDRIAPHCDLLQVRVRYGAHDQMLMLQQCDMLAGMLVDMVHGRFHLAGCLATLRQRRRRSSVFWLNFADTLAKRGHLGTAQKALWQAVDCPGGDAPSFPWLLHATVTSCLLAASHGNDDGTGSGTAQSEAARANGRVGKREAFIREATGAFAAFHQRALDKRDQERGRLAADLADRDATIARLTNELARRDRAVTRPVGYRARRHGAAGWLRKAAKRRAARNQAGGGHAEHANLSPGPCQEQTQRRGAVATVRKLCGRISILFQIQR